jgi:phosphate transport system substrate-binding protein
MHRELAVQMLTGALFATLCSGVAAAADISGAGSTFVYPVLAKWADTYKTGRGVAVNYQSIGSGSGIKQIENKTVDFGASDAPLLPNSTNSDCCNFRW